MSLSQPPYTPLGYQVGPSPSIVPGAPPPLPGGSGEAPDSLARRIDAAISAVPLDKRGTFIAVADLSRTSAVVMVRMGSNVSFLGRVSKPWSGPLEAEGMIRVNFAMTPPPVVEPKRLQFKDYYHALRAKREGLKNNSRFRAFVKAFAMEHLKAHPYLDGERWFDRA